MKKKVGIGPLETEVFSALNSIKKGSVKDIHVALGRGLAITTVATVLDRLYRKKLVNREISTTGYIHYIYEILPIDQINDETMLKGIINSFATAFKEPLLSYFVATIGSLDDVERKRIITNIENFMESKKAKDNNN